MKTRFSKVLSALLSICMILSMSSFTILADDAAELAGQTEFYVQYGANGDGLSAESPAGSLGAVVATINQQYPDGGDVDVYIIKNANEPTDGKFDSTDDCVYLEYQNIPAHNATVTYKSYDEDDKSSIIFYNKWATSQAPGHIMIAGPTVFDGIKLIDSRTDNYTGDVYCNGNNVEFKNTEMYRCRKADSYKLTPWLGHFNAGGLRNYYSHKDVPATIIFDAASIAYIGDYNVSGYADASGSNGVKWKNDVTTVIGEGYLDTFRIDGAKASFPASFGRNVNVVFNGTEVKNFGNNNNPVAITGALQIIRNDGAAVAAAPAASGAVYDITASEGVRLDVTATAGTFTVETDGVAYVASADGKTIYYGDEEISLDPGVITVNYAADLDEIIAGLEEPEAADGYEFDEWDTSVEGVIKAKFARIEDETEIAYYVKKGGTGAGRSVDAPAGEIRTVIGAINNDGYKEGDEVTVYVIDSGEASMEFIKSDCVIGYSTSANYDCPSHTATIKWTSYDPNVKSIIAHCNWQSADSNGIHFSVQGPSIFENIMILDIRNSKNGGTDIYLNHYPVEFHDTIFADLEGVNQSNPGKVFYPSSTHFSMGMIRGNKTVERDSYVYIDNASIIGDYLNIMGYTDSGKAQGIKGDVTLEIGSGTVKNLNFIGTNAGATETIDGNVSILLNDGATVNKVSNTSVPVVTGSVQVVLGYGASIPEGASFKAFKNSSKTTTSDVFVVAAGSPEVSLGLTDKVGTYSVEADGVAYAVNSDSTVFYYGEDVLKLDAGKYTINVAADLDAVMEAVNAPATDILGNAFAGWYEETPGKYVATYDDGNGSGTPTVFYAQYGANGNGTSVDSPAGSLAALVETINVLYPDGGDVTIKIIPHANEPTDAWDSADKSVFLQMGGIPAHKATITYTSFSNSKKAKIAFWNKWEASGVGDHVILAGPSNFVNVTLVDNRSDNATRDFNCNYHNVTFENSDLVVIPKANNYKFTPWVQRTGHFSVGGNRSNGTFGTGDTYVKLDATAINSINDINVSGYADTAGQKTQNKQGNVTLELVGGTLKVLRIDNNKAGVAQTFGGDVTILVNGTQVTSYGNSNVPSIAGKLAIVRTNGASLGEIAKDITSTKYDITVAEGIDLYATETAGKFDVECDGVAYAVSEDGRNIYYGAETITLAKSGAYEVSSAASVDAIKAAAQEPAHTLAYRFDGWDDSVDGVLTAILTYVGETGGVPTYFVKNGGKGNGLSPTSPFGTVTEAVDAMLLAGYGEGDEVVLYVIDAYEDPYKFCEDGSSSIGKVFKGNTYYSGATSWADKTNRQPAYFDFDLTIAAYDYETTGKNTWLIWNPHLGLNVNVTFTGNVTFENINLLGPRPYDREYFINGYNVTFDDCRFYFLTHDYHSGGGGYEGNLFERQKFMLAGSTGKGGVLTINSPFTMTGEYGVHIAGTGGGTFSEHQTVNLAHEDIDTAIFWGGTSGTATFQNGLSIVANGVVSNYVSKDNPITINNGFEVIAPIGANIFGLTLPSNVTVTGGTWNIKIDSEEIFIAPTETTGTYVVTDENLAAVAGNEATGATYFSLNGVLTIPAGDYTVSSIPASELSDMMVEVWFDNEPADGAHYQGYTVYLPVLSDTVDKKFIGWELDGEDGLIEGGITLDIPEDATEMFFYSIFEDFEDTVVAFVDQANGSDDEDGSSDYPVQSMSKAFEIVLASDASIKKVAIVGTYGFGNAGSIPMNTERVIITGIDDQSTLDINGDAIRAQGPITLENLVLAQTTSAGGKIFSTGNADVVFGEGLIVSSKFAVRVGNYSPTSGPVKATFLSGNFTGIEVGHFWISGNRGTVDSAEIIVDGANIGAMTFTSNGWMAEQVGCDFTGAVNITVNSGSVGSVSATTPDASNKYAAFKDTVTMILNNGITTNFSTAIKADKGVWVISTSNVDGCSLEATTTTGTYNVIGGKTALATNIITGAQYISTQGELIIPQGQYSIDFVDKVFYINDGENITIYNDCSLDLTTVKHSEHDGELFLGWTFDNGNTCGTNVDLKEGDALVANYVPFDPATDFTIIGAQIRTTGKQGLRFIVEANNEFFNSLPDKAEFGTIVLPTDATLGRSMFIDKEIVKEWSWDAATKSVFTPKVTNGYKPSKVVAEKLYKVTDEATQFTLCITDITEDKFYRNYSVRGYVIYTDYNGIEHTLYSDYYQTNIYRVAKAALAAGEEPAATFEGIKEYVEVDRKNAYMAANYDNRTLLSGYPTTADTNPNHAMYSLANGIKIREVEITSGNAGGDPVEILHFADIHLNFINEKDIELGEVNTLATYRGRSWLRNGSSAYNIQRMMEYGSFMDKIVVTGDIMDYFSWGCAEIMTKTMVDYCDNILMAIGNHEPAELMQPDTSGLSNKYSKAEHYERIQSMWPNNVYYHGEIVKNDEGVEKVMIVVLDDQADTYDASQIAEPFARDIEIAREKNIPILIFQHDPICSNNPNEKALGYFYEGGDTSGIPADMTNRFAGRPAQAGDASTMEVYNLIVMNPDVVKGVFCGHWHNHMYSEILAKNPDGSFMTDKNGNYVVIPQYIVTAAAYGAGNGIKITVK